METRRLKAVMKDSIDKSHTDTDRKMSTLTSREQPTALDNRDEEFLRNAPKFQAKHGK